MDINLGGRMFRNIESGAVVEVQDSFEDIAVMVNGTKMSVSDLLNPKLYIPFSLRENNINIREQKTVNITNDEIDPDSFFNNRNYTNITEQLKSIPLDEMPLETNDVVRHYSDNNFNISNESAVIMTDEISEREEIARKYSQQYGVNINTGVDEMVKQQESFSKILNGDEKNVEKVVRIDTDMNYNNPPIQNDPIFNTFKNVKRRDKFTMELSIEDKIPEPDFIKIMENNYEISMIDYLTEQITNKLLSDIDDIKRKIRNEIEILVYGENQQYGVNEKGWRDNFKNGNFITGDLSINDEDMIKEEIEIIYPEGGTEDSIEVETISDEEYDNLINNNGEDNNQIIDNLDTEDDERISSFTIVETIENENDEEE